jgi:hypothetical protein
MIFHLNVSKCNNLSCEQLLSNFIILTIIITKTPIFQRLYYETFFYTL